MYDIFNGLDRPEGSIIKPPAFELVKRVYSSELQNVKKYYNSRVSTVKSNHILCRIVMTCTSPLEYDLPRYMSVIYARAPYVAKYFNLTSDITEGSIFDGDFYGENSSEILLYDEEYFDHSESFARWRDLRPVEVLWHPISDFGLNLPNGVTNHTSSGLSVIKINIPMLMLMYRGFAVEQMSKRIYGDEEVSLLGIPHFVKMYVLPSMMRSHLDIAIVKRLTNYIEGAPMSASTHQLPLATIDYTRKVDLVLRETNKYLQTHPMTFEQMLKHIPCVSAENAYRALVMPDIAPTRQAWWALICTRLPVMSSLIKIDRATGGKNNTDHVVHLKWDLKRLLRDRGLLTILPNEIRDEFLYMIEEIMQS